MSRRLYGCIAVVALTGLVLVSVPYSGPVKEFASTQADVIKSNLKEWTPFNYSFDPSLEADDYEQVDNQVGIAPSKLVALPPPVPLTQHDPVAANWRTHLDTEHTHPNAIVKFTDAYVLSDPSHKTRRDRMNLLAKAHNLNLVFVDKTPATSATISWIAERVAELRRRKLDLILTTLARPARRIIHLNTSTPYLFPSKPWPVLDHPFYSISPKWIELHKNKLPEQLPLPSLNDDQFDGSDWLSYLHGGNAVDPDDAYLNISEALYEMYEPNPDLQVKAETIAEWYDHYGLYKRMDENKVDIALVLDDTVDMEWDFELIWKTASKRLPTASNAEGFPEWQAVFMGHDGLYEFRHPVFFHPLLHHAADPRGLFGYLINRSGYKALLSMLDDPWIAYQTRLDVAISTFIQNNAFNAYSIAPPVIVHLPSDLADLYDNKDKGQEILLTTNLSDSTMERIWTTQGFQVTLNSTARPRPNHGTYHISSWAPQREVRISSLQKAQQQAEEEQQAESHKSNPKQASSKQSSPAQASQSS